MPVVEYTNRELGIRLDNVLDKLEEGFKGVHERQDIANHGISKNVKRITCLENWRWYLVGGGSVLLFGFTMAINFL